MICMHLSTLFSAPEPNSIRLLEQHQKWPSVNDSRYAMSAKKIENLLKQALIHDGEMQYELYEYELKELLDELRSSMAKDQDEYIFAVTENSGHVAMLLIEKAGRVYINDEAREKLKTLWQTAYESNMKKLIPAFAKQLNEGEIPINGVKAAR